MSRPDRHQDRAPAHPLARKRGWRLALAWAAIGLAASALLGWATPFGLGLRDDSFTYLSAAETLRASGRYARHTGDGSFRPVTNFPPLYSSSLAGVGFLTSELPTAARTLNILLLGSLVLLSGITVFRATDSAWASVVAASITALSDVFLSVGSWALSELLFLCLISSGTLFLLEHLRNPRRFALVVAAMCLGLAVLTRYSGLPFVAAGSATLLLLRRREALRNGDLAVFLAVAVLPLAAFLVRNLTVADSLVNRPAPYWHPPSLEKLLLGVQAVAHWILPGRVLSAAPGWFSTLVAGGLAGLLVYATASALSGRRGGSSWPGEHTRYLVVILWLGIAWYMFFLLATIYLLDALTPLNERLLSPLYLEVMLLGVALAEAFWRRWGRARRLAAAAGLTVILGFLAIRLLLAAVDLRTDGQGYAGRKWRESAVLAFVCSRPDIPIYSNDLPAIYFRCGRMARGLPYPVNLASGVANPSYASDLEMLREQVHTEGALVVFVGPYDAQRMDRTGFSPLASQLSLIRTFEDGLVYGD